MLFAQLPQQGRPHNQALLTLQPPTPGHTCCWDLLRKTPTLLKSFSTVQAALCSSLNTSFVAIPPHPPPSLLFHLLSFFYGHLVTFLYFLCRFGFWVHNQWFVQQILQIIVLLIAKISQNRDDYSVHVSSDHCWDSQPANIVTSHYIPIKDILGMTEPKRWKLRIISKNIQENITQLHREFWSSTESSIDQTCCRNRITAAKFYEALAMRQLASKWKLEA